MKMVRKIISKPNRKHVSFCFMILMICCFGTMMIFEHNKIGLLKDMEANLNKRLNNIKVMEERIGKLHHDLNKSLKRQKRHIVLENTKYDACTNSTNDKTVENHNQSHTSQHVHAIYNFVNGSTGGAVYTRWGRTVCGDDSELVYDGIVGGSLYSHVGGAVNPLCLPKSPIWSKFVDGFQDHAFMYGAEYQGISESIFDLSNSRKLNDENIPCAVCRNRLRQSVLMLPARNVCYPGWTLEYKGYLMTGHHEHKRSSEYICVDDTPEVTDAGYRNENGYIFYAVEAKCGSLPCPSYVEGREFTCAVCTR